MSPAQPAPEPTRTRSPRGRARRRPGTAESEEPLAELHTRCAGVAIAASIGYLAILATTAVRPAALNVAVTVGLLIALGAVAGLCALGAILAWAVAQMPEPSLDRQAETIEWAIRLGEDLADAYHAAPSGSSPGDRWESPGRRSPTASVGEGLPESHRASRGLENLPRPN